ncbi:MAG: hypothetical protein PHW79_03600 [Candidatus Marinimicrobia bacterium]|nr:hypothetical protein [Candidatus Neomarinimicrobiota bacterium]
MKKRIIVGLMVGLAAGILDVIPMLIQKLTWDANLSAFTLWIVVGFILATSNLHLPAVIKGIVIAFVCLLPSLFIIGWNNPASLIPVVIMTGILGSLVGFVFHKLVKE